MAILLFVFVTAIDVIIRYRIELIHASYVAINYNITAEYFAITRNLILPFFFQG